MSLRGKIVFASGKAADFDIWVLRLADRSLTQLTKGSGLNDSPRWSPDGSKVAYISYGDDLISSLWVMDANGSNQRRLTSTVHAQSPSWSPDGRSIIFSANAAKKDDINLCRIDLQTETVEVLLERPGQETEPCMSPEGTHLIYSATSLDNSAPFAARDTGIYEYNLNTKTERGLFEHGARDFCPTYSPDGQQIAFISHRKTIEPDVFTNRVKDIHTKLDKTSRKSVDAAIKELRELEGDSDIFVGNRDGTNLRQLTTSSCTDTSVRWSPCGEYLVFASAPGEKSTLERLKVVEVKTGKIIPLEYDRTPLMSEINAIVEDYMNLSPIRALLLPDFIERPLTIRKLGETFFGEEHQPDWTAGE